MEGTEGTRSRRYVLLTLIGVSALVGPFLFGFFYGSRMTRVPELFDGLFNSFVEKHGDEALPQTEKNLHVIIPATNPGTNLCKLLLTTGILGFPEATAVGWNHTGIFDGSKSHLFKITEILAFLRSLPPSSDEDLTLILDGFDVWLQLRPSVVISRYYTVLDKHDERLRDEGILGQQSSFYEGVNTTIASKIVFGADKFPAPPFPSEAYWWAAPKSPLPANYFGNDTDSGLMTNRPRWLNSGTIMGPVKEMRDFFSAAVGEILRDANTDEGIEVSDQYYMAKVWGRQEVSRGILRDGMEKFMESVPSGADVPVVTDGKRTEYGVCLDDWMDIFQLGGGWDRVLGFMRYDQATEVAEEGIEIWKLPEEIMESERPFAALNDQDPGLNWDAVPLASNLLNGAPMPLFHTTSAKRLREEWWPQLWFHPYAEELHKGARRQQMQSAHPEVFLEMDGVRWKQYRTPLANQDRAGMWRANGEFMPWQELCGNDEDKVYIRPNA